MLESAKIISDSNNRAESYLENLKPKPKNYLQK